MKIKEQRPFLDIELKLCTINKNAQPDENVWNKGITLKSNDTIMSCKLYQDNCVIMAKPIREASYDFFPSDFT